MTSGVNINISKFDSQFLSDSKSNDITFNSIYGSQKILITSGSNLNSKFIITSNNIGINCINPIVSLHINSNNSIRVPSGTTLNRPLNSNYGDFRYNTTLNQFEGFNETWSSIGIGLIDLNLDTKILAETNLGYNNDQLQFYNKNSENMRIESNGDSIIYNDLIIKKKFGIGTSNPNNEIQVIGTVNTSQSIISTFIINNSNNIFDNNSLINTINDFIFTNSGNIGLSNYSPSYKLDIINNSRFQSNVIISSNIGIGTTNPLSSLHVYNSLNNTPSTTGIHFGCSINKPSIELCANINLNSSIDFLKPNLAFNGRILYDYSTSRLSMSNISGGVYIGSSGTTWASISDSNIKKNIKPLNYNIDELYNLKPILYDLIIDDTNNSSRIGLIAQNVINIIPEIVNENIETKILSIKYDDLIPVIINYIKELNIYLKLLEEEVLCLEK